MKEYQITVKTGAADALPYFRTEWMESQDVAQAIGSDLAAVYGGSKVELTCRTMTRTDTTFWTIRMKEFISDEVTE